jgi:putative SOS response-associated peptidase YedK
MCGKFVQMKDWEAMVELAELVLSTSHGLSETITPMRVASVIRVNADGKREVARMRWGFVPANAADQNIGTQFIHARAETIEEKPTYRDAFFNRRGLVIVRTFNEGREITPTKTEQHVITPRDGKPLAIAVIWERWRKLPLESFAMVTTAANALIGTITDRMPAVIAPEHWGRWLGEEPASVDELKAILKPFEGDWDMEAAARAKSPSPKKPSAQQELF